MQSGLGRPFVELVRDANHADGVNEVTQIPPASDLQMLNPSFYFEGQRALVVDMPPGARRYEGARLRTRSARSRPT